MSQRRSGKHSGNVGKGLVAGLIGGLVASWTMNQFQALWAKVTESTDSTQGGDSSKRESKGEQQQPDEEQDDATVKAASAISEAIFDHELTKGEKKVAGPAVHYAFGTAVGGLYGAAAELAPEVTAGAGLPFGAAFWLTADEAAVPLLGLSKGPTEYPLSTHAYALASHCVYGLTAEVVRRAVRSAL